MHRFLIILKAVIIMIFSIAGLFILEESLLRAICKLGIGFSAFMLIILLIAPEYGTEAYE